MLYNMCMEPLMSMASIEYHWFVYGLLLSYACLQVDTESKERALRD